MSGGRDIGLSTHISPARDISLIDGMPIEFHDFASPDSSLGGGIGFNAVNKRVSRDQMGPSRKISIGHKISARITE